MSGSTAVPWQICKSAENVTNGPKNGPIHEPQREIKTQTPFTGTTRNIILAGINAG